MTPALVAPLLEARGISKSYGAIRALDQVSFGISECEVCGLIGPNGSGKTTLFDCCVSQTRLDGGTIRLDGREITHWSMDRIAREGRTVRSFQRTAVFGSMTVEENIVAAAQFRVVPSLARAFLVGRRARAGNEEIRSRAASLLKMVNLDRMSTIPAKELSYGQQKLLQFVCAVAPQPRLVLLDEPFAGVSPMLVARMTELIRWANEKTGATFLIIEHNVDALAQLCPRILVLHQGRLIGDGPPASILRDPSVVEAYLGG